MRNDFYGIINELNNVFGVNGGYKSFPVDVIEIKNGYQVEAEIPGVNKEDIEISFNDGELTIEASCKEKDDRKYIIHERSQMKFKRTLAFGEVNEDNMSAKYENGILNITIMLKVPEEKKPTKINIE